MYTLLEGGPDIFINTHPHPPPVDRMRNTSKNIICLQLCWLVVIIIKVSTSLADPGGTGTHAPYRCIFFHFHAFFWMILPNNKSFYSKFSSWCPLFYSVWEILDLPLVT